ncbi:MAG TPA: HEAT repeat domain-containing protein [Anaerohalosphaeraceae bacterium]|nr:HEAT repeat domain-containing protein [Anaerohalosphaeraceae bacterium]
MRKSFWMLLFAIAAGLSNVGIGASLDAAGLRTLLEQSRQYDFGQSRRVLTDIENQIKAVYDSPEELAKAEAVLLEMLQSDCSFALKDFLCRQLSVIGSARSVPALAGLLKDPKTAAPAQYALVRIPVPEADKVLIEHLAKSEPSVRIGLLTSLGLRRTQTAAETIAPYAADENQAVAEAALSALGQIGTPEAAAALEKQMEKILPALKTRGYDVLLACAEKRLQSGQKAEAASLFQKIYTQKDLSGLLRAAALQGLLQAVSPEQADRQMLEGLEDADAQIRTVCLLWACRLNRPAVIQKARQMMSSLPDWQQVQFLTALGETKSSGAQETALSALSASSPEVVLAALETLSVVGDASCIQPLAQSAAQSSERRIRQAAQTALERLPDPQTDAAIAQLLEKMDFTAENQSAQSYELILAAGRRGTRDAFPLILKAASVGSRSVRRVAMESLAALAGPEDIPRMTYLLDNPDAEVIRVLAAAASKQAERTGRAKPFLPLLAGAGPQKTAAVYQILGRLGDPDSLEILRKGLQSENSDLQEAAFRALTEWPGPEVTEEMKRWSAEGKSESRRVLAFRAYVRMVRQSEMPLPQKASTLAEAMGLAPREEEKKIVLASLADVPSEQTLKAAVGCLMQESIRPEAQAAVLAICQKMSSRRPELCRDALTKLLESSPPDEITKTAQEMLNAMQKSR